MKQDFIIYILGILFFCSFFSTPMRAAEKAAEYQLPFEAAKDVYERPYSFSESNINKTLLKRNTLLLVGAGVGTMGILYLMPSSFTNWEDDGKNPFSKWWDNVTDGPVWDEDDLFLNYIAHPYCGAIYYMGARSAGANAFESFLYSFALSTFFWEYGIESFAEVPSIQDLIVTPLGGAIVGEGFYLAKRHIYENEGKLMNSKVLGSTAVFLMDPMTEITNYIWDEKEQEDLEKHAFSLQAQPIMAKDGSMGYGISLSFSF